MLSLFSDRFILRSAEEKTSKSILVLPLSKSHMLYVFVCESREMICYIYRRKSGVFVLGPVAKLVESGMMLPDMM